MSLQAGSTHYGTTSILVVEARAMRDVHYAAVQVGFHKIIVEDDNKIVIQVLQGKVKTLWQIQCIIRDTHARKDMGIHIIANKGFIEANMTANRLFKFGHFITNSFFSDLCFSPVL